MTFMASTIPAESEASNDKASPSQSDGQPFENVSPKDQMLNELVQLFKLLADDTRVRILFFLQQSDELNVRQLCKLLRQRQPSVSHHLALLRDAGLINMRRDGKHNFYRLIPTKLEQLITLFFGSVPGQPARICFEGFELRYAPAIEVSDPARLK
jgi:ArsR family transcriptional regulator